MSTGTTTTVTTGKASVRSQPRSQDPMLTEIFEAYFDARRNKRNTASQVRFERALSANLVSLYESVRDRSYTPGRSACFVVKSPVRREVYVAPFRDRIIHHWLFNHLAPLFESSFIYDSYSCRKGKGTLMGIARLEHHIRSCSDNGHRGCFVLRLDISGYFMSIDRALLHGIVMGRLIRLRNAGRLPQGFDWNTVTFLLGKVIFNDPTKGCRIIGRRSDWDGLPASKTLTGAAPGCGLPIGNLTSQLFSNIYLDEVDEYAKRVLKLRHYGRYVDDIYVADTSEEKLRDAEKAIGAFLEEKLRLRLNGRKTVLVSLPKGVPFLGAVVSPSGRSMNRTSRRRMDRRLDDAERTVTDPYALAAIRNSCRGYASHFNA